MKKKYKIEYEKPRNNELLKAIVHTDVKPKSIKGNSIGEFVTRRESTDRTIGGNKSTRDF